MHEPAENNLLYPGTEKSSHLFKKVENELSFSVNVCRLPVSMIIKYLHNNSLKTEG
jgi:hypothetical protein